MSRSRESARPDDPLGQALLDFHRGQPGTLRYRDGPHTEDGRVEAFYFPSREDWPDGTVDDLEWLAESGGPVLDVGCGAGQHLEWFDESGVEALGIDVSPGAVETARRRGAEAVAVADMRSLPVPAHAFEAVFCVGTQLGLGGTLPGVEALLAGFARVTSADAVAVVDGYDPTALGTDFLGYRPDPRDGIARRCFHLEYDPPGDDTDRIVGRTLRFLLAAPDRLRPVARAASWDVSTVRWPDPDAGYYRVRLHKDVQ